VGYGSDGTSVVILQWQELDRTTKHYGCLIQSKNYRPRAPLTIEQKQQQKKQQKQNQITRREENPNCIKLSPQMWKEMSGLAESMEVLNVLPRFSWAIPI